MSWFWGPLLLAAFTGSAYGCYGLYVLYLWLNDEIDLKMW